VKKFTTFLVLAALLAIMPGCFTLNARHNRNHMKSFSNDMVRLHQDFDRHFLNYDWDNPNDH
jgi:hypothetical protein